MRVRYYIAKKNQDWKFTTNFQEYNEQGKQIHEKINNSGEELNLFETVGNIWLRYKKNGRDHSTTRPANSVVFMSNQKTKLLDCCEFYIEGRTTLKLLYASRKQPFSFKKGDLFPKEYPYLKEYLVLDKGMFDVHIPWYKLLVDDNKISFCSFPIGHKNIEMSEFEFEAVSKFKEIIEKLR